MTLIRDRYELLELVGKGGQGEVHKALDRMHSRLVALKVRTYSDEGGSQQLLSEARTLLDLKPHRGIPLVREDFFEGDRYYLVMDWIEGRSLDKQASDPNQIISYLADVAEALDHLHGHEPPVVHRDVKPANIVIDGGRAILVDFGIAGRSGLDTSGGTGSRGFIGPEVAGGLPATPASDVFSLAATAFALFVGEPPRPGLKPKWPAIGKEAAKLIEVALQRGLAFEPSLRPPSASALIESMRAGGGVPHNLRLEPSLFIAREAELAELRALILGERLVTVVGTGGMGKTRLAERTGADLLTDFPDGVFFVDLSSIRNPALVAGTVASSMGIEPEDSGLDSTALVVSHIADKSMLLILDNCEHLSEVSALLSGRLIEACPRVHLVVTSRSPLSIPAEVVWRIPVMGVPMNDDLSSVRASPAARLFNDRAGKIRRGFKPTNENAGDIARVVRRLEGIPLAIELAASRIAAFSPAEIDRYLEDRLSWLVSRSPASDSRQQSLRATIDWSYDLLDENERQLFQWLSVFIGGFTYESASSVCGNDLVQSLEALVEKSLVTAEDRESSTRYSMLDSLRSYAEEKLFESGNAEAARLKQFEWFSGWVDAAEGGLGGPKQGEILQALEDEHANIREALDWAVTKRHERGLHLASAMWRFWEVRGHTGEGRRWVEALLETCRGADDLAKARAFRAAGSLALNMGDYAAAENHLKLGAELAERLEDERLLAAILNAQAVCRGSVGDYPAERRLYEQCLVLWRKLGHERGVAVTLGNLGTAAYEQGDFQAAQGYFSDALDLRRRLDDTHGIAASLNGLGLVAAANSSLTESCEFFEQARSIWSGIGYKRGVGIASTNLGNVALLRHDLHEAGEILRAAESILREVGATSDLAETLESLGAVEIDGGSIDEAEARLREGLQLRWTIGDMPGVASSLEGLAAVELRRNEIKRAASFFFTARELRRETGSFPPPHRVDLVDQVARSVDGIRPAKRSIDAVVADALGSDTALGMHS